jgi:acetyl esterase
LASSPTGTAPWSWRTKQGPPVLAAERSLSSTGLKARRNASHPEETVITKDHGRTKGILLRQASPNTIWRSFASRVAGAGLATALAASGFSAGAQELEGTPLALEPETAAYIERASEQPPRADQLIAELRDGYRANLIAESVAPDPSVASMDLTIPGPAGPLQARLYTPDTAGEAPGPLLFYVHGGGFVVGDLEAHDQLVRLIASSAGMRVPTLDYRKAPEAPYPAAHDDDVAAYRWALANVAQLGADPTKVAIGGESADATDAVAAALTLRDAGDRLPAALWIMSPALDATTSGASYDAFGDRAGRTTAEFDFLWSQYGPTSEERASPGVSPLMADLARLPALFIYPAEFDPARDDGECFAAKAEAAGVPVVLETRSGLVHQYPEITGESSRSRDPVVDAARDLSEALE